MNEEWKRKQEEISQLITADEKERIQTVIGMDFEQTTCDSCGRRFGRDETLTIKVEDAEVTRIECNRANPCGFYYPTSSLVKAELGYHKGDLKVIKATAFDNSNPDDPYGEKITIEELQAKDEGET